MADGKTFRETRETAKQMLIAIAEEVGIENLTQEMHTRLLDYVQNRLVNERMIGADKILETMKVSLETIERLLKGN